MQLELGNYGIHILDRFDCTYHFPKFMERYVDIICRDIVMWCGSYSTVITEQRTLLHLNKGWIELRTSNGHPTMHNGRSSIRTVTVSIQITVRIKIVLTCTNRYASS